MREKELITECFYEKAVSILNVKSYLKEINCTV